MKTAKRRLKIVATTASAVLHAVVLAVVAVQAPRLRIEDDTAGPPEPIIPLILAPRAPPAEAGAAAAPVPIRLHRRPPRGGPIAPPVEPLPAPAPAPEEAPVERPKSDFHPAPLPQGPKGDLRAALRGSPVGCGNADAVGLNRAEREGCDQTLGARARIIPYKGLALDPDKQSEFDRAAARKEENRRYRQQQGGPPVAPGRSGPGQGAADLGRSIGSTNPELKVPF